MHNAQIHILTEYCGISSEGFSTMHCRRSYLQIDYQLFLHARIISIITQVTFIIRKIQGH